MLQTALHQRGLVEQIPEVVYAVSLARTQRIATRAGTFSVHHLAPEVFGGYEETKSGAKLATAEKALFDFAYLSAGRSRLFTALPELSLPRGFRRAELQRWVAKSPRSEAAPSPNENSRRFSPRLLLERPPRRTSSPGFLRGAGAFAGSPVDRAGATGENRAEMSANTCEFRVGRLMEIRVGRGYRSVDDVDEMIRMIGDRVIKLPPNLKYVIAADWRNVTVMSPETAVRARAMLAKSNARVERSSILTLADQSTANLQVQRLVREAENENRRHFVKARDQHDWLSEVLTPEESSRLAEFLGLTGAAVAP